MDLWMDRWLVGWLDGAAENNNWSKSECKLSTDGNYQGQSRCQSVDAEMAALNCLKRRIHQFQIHREINVSYSICIVRCFWIFEGILFLIATKMYYLERLFYQFQIQREINVSYIVVRYFWFSKGILFLSTTKIVEIIMFKQGYFGVGIEYLCLIWCWINFSGLTYN